MGCDGINIDSAKGLEAVLTAPHSGDRPLVIGAKINPARYAAQF